MDVMMFTIWCDVIKGGEDLEKNGFIQFWVGRKGCLEKVFWC